MIVFSRILADSVPKDGRRHIHEWHQDDMIRDIHIYYMADNKTDVEQEMIVRIDQLNQELAAQSALVVMETQANKSRAATLLKLADVDMAVILKMDMSDLTSYKTELENIANG